MSGNITTDRFPSPSSVPGNQQSYGELAALYPELADGIVGLVSWRDTGQPDQHDKAFNKKWPSMQPAPWLSPSLW